MSIPVLVIIGGKDIQVDIHADGDSIQTAAANMTNTTFTFPPNANHVLKDETRSRAEVLANLPTRPGYNEDDTHLDPQALNTILAWLHRVLTTNPGSAAT